MRKLLKVKIYTFIAVFGLVGAVISVPAYFLYSRVEKTIIDETNKQASSLAIALSNFIENNSDKYEKLCSATGYSDGNFDIEYYKSITKLLRDIKESTGAKFIYTEKPASETGILRILDAEAPASKDHIPFGSTYDITPMKKKALEQEEGAVSGMTEHKNNEKLISAFAPIKSNRTGKILGLVGVDFSPDYINGVVAGIRNMIITVSFLSMLLVGTAVNILLAIRYKSMITDYMTKLYNKYHFENCIKWSVSDALKNGTTFSLMVIDIDDFKIVNDRCGHLTGDEVLKKIAQSIRENTRDNDLCFRYGGDEFVVILPNITKEQAATVGKRIQSKLLSNNLLGENTENAADIKISLSLGIAQWEPKMSPEDLTEWADRAMYASKNTGKNRLTLSDNPI